MITQFFFLNQFRVVILILLPLFIKFDLFLIFLGFDIRKKSWLI